MYKYERYGKFVNKIIYVSNFGLYIEFQNQSNSIKNLQIYYFIILL